MTRSLRPGRPGSDESGAVAIIVAILATTLLVFAAFAVDIGNAYSQSRQLSVSADAAALAAAKKVGLAMPANTKCTPAILASINATQVARTEADAVNTANSPKGVTEPVDVVNVTCQSGGDAIEVTIGNSRGVKTQLAGVIGIDQIKPNSYAVARWFKVPTGGGLRPWAICDQQVLAAVANPNQTFATGLDNQVGTCGTTANGNWGSVDFNGKTSGNAAQDLADWTQNGYPGSVSIPDPALPADPGVSNSSALGTAFTSLVNQVVLFPVVTAYNAGGSGNNASFQAVGVVTVKVCGVFYKTAYNVDAAGNASDCWVNPYPTSSPATASIPVTIANAPNNVADLLNTTSGGFTADMVGASVTIPGAGNGGTALTTTIKTFVSANQVVLANKAQTAVTAPVTITVSYTNPGTWPLGLSKDNGGNYPIGHVQFRYVDYVSSFVSDGTAPSPCALNDPRSFCTPVVALWR